MKMQTVTIPFRGGLNLASNAQELLAAPNEAIRLTNFECSKAGGYRRISGFEPFGPAVPGAGPIEGVKTYRGALAVRDGTVYHLEEGGTNWTSLVSGRSAGRYMFVPYTFAGKSYVFAVDGVNAPLCIRKDVTGTEGGDHVAEITEGTALVGAKYLEIYKNQLVIAGCADDPSAFYYSSHATTDLITPEDDAKEIPQENFNGSTAGSIAVGEPITGLKMHRDILYVFCERSIHKVVGLETDAPEVKPVTNDIGCIDGFTIQEIGGDLMFLAHDGLRNIKNTERLNDIELGVVSRKVSPVLDPVINDVGRYEFYSTVLREKNQYRLWFIDRNNADSAQRGIIASYTYEPNQDRFAWAFSELEGLGVTCVDSDFQERQERILHGNQLGEVHQQEKGHTFNGARIFYVYQSPYTDFGDPSIRKVIHKIGYFVRAEGDIQMGLELRYNYENGDTHQPLIYPMEPMALAAIFGDSSVRYGDPLIRYGARNTLDRSLYTEGSGFFVSFRIKSLNTIDDYPFDLQSMQVDMTAGGKV